MADPRWDEVMARLAKLEAAVKTLKAEKAPAKGKEK